MNIPFKRYKKKKATNYEKRPIDWKEIAIKIIPVIPAILDLVERLLY